MEHQYFDFSAFQDQAEDSGEAQGQHTQHFAHAVNLPLQDHSNSAPYHHTNVQPMSCDVKPRLTKEQHDILETHFQSQHKPPTGVKRGFAESLGVSLDKVNNWFQNRRAKSKQDAKKAASQVTLHQNYSQMFGSDSEPSPYQPAPDYSAMMRHMSSEENLPGGLGISQMHQTQPQVNGSVFDNHVSNHQQLQSFNYPADMSDVMFDNPFDENRKTITQDQFDAMNQNGGMVNSNGDFETLDASFSGDHDALSQVFPEFNAKQDLATYPYSFVAPPLSSNDSTVPSMTSEQSMPTFPSSNVMQSHPSISVASSISDWNDSRSSSLASAYNGTMGAPTLPVQQQAQAATSPWEPGKSKPVDVDAMKDQFQQALAQANQARASMEQTQAFV